MTPTTLGTARPGSSIATSRRAAVASFIGTTIEWYDFMIYGTAAALIFNVQFFPSKDPVVGTLLAFLTLGIGFIARPLGGIVAGHFGDRVGRKRMLVLTLLLMGSATALVGVLPNFAAIGIAAPIILTLLRLVQGFSAGGEWGGAALMSVEHAPAGRRGFFGASVGLGVPAGLILANAVFLVVQASMSAEAFTAWGWRIPFLLSIVLVLIGLYIRLRIAESPVFAAVTSAERRSRVPVLQVIRRHPKELVLATLAYLANNGVGYLFLTFLISYGTVTLGIGRGTVLGIVVIGAVVWLVTTLLGGWLSDHIGRRNTYLIGYGLLAAWLVPFFRMIDTTEFSLMVLAVAVLTTGLGISSGPQSALFAEMFAPEVRYSGASLAFALGAILGGGFAPLIATALVAGTGGSFAVALYGAGMALISFVATLLIRESALRKARAADAEQVSGAGAGGR